MRSPRYLSRPSRLNFALYLPSIYPILVPAICHAWLSSLSCRMALTVPRLLKCLRLPLYYWHLYTMQQEEVRTVKWWESDTVGTARRLYGAVSLVVALAHRCHLTVGSNLYLGNGY